jgi:hypothetical protein
MSTRYFCVHQVTPRCDRGNGKPARKRCRGCGGSFATQVGQHGVFVWRGDGGYRREDAVALFERESAAEAYTRRDESYVVRWIS